ncbi:hypothetical protein [Sphingomonas sp. R1]|uniref:hypothetical protein n=1 Tax=Sphingomonas sp. R1 TaxID=399176 RepID=UPI0022257164|nr:hypothetical protein [Sphingomonas sp. R1]UYY77570.1 hypothetical protein OIM94_00735 [Sphingomonas sp. R1]
MTVSLHDQRPHLQAIQPIWHVDGPAEPRTPQDILAFLGALIDTHAAADKAPAVPDDVALAHRDERHQTVRNAARLTDHSAETDLELLVRDALGAFRFGDAPGITINGPTVFLRPAMVGLVALALHELSINSIKFGMLGDAGRNSTLAIRWHCCDDGLFFTWRERGVPILRLATADTSGFGSAFLTTVLPERFGIETSLAILPGGIRYLAHLRDYTLRY